jgi:hypothetical protein
MLWVMSWFTWLVALSLQRLVFSDRLVYEGLVVDEGAQPYYILWQWYFDLIVIVMEQ